MAIQNGNAHAADLGLRALALFLRLHGVTAEPDQLRDRCGSETIGIRAMLRCARELGVKVRSRTTRWKRLASIQLPGIASLRDGGFLLLGKVDDQAALVLHPTSPHPKLMTRAEFNAVWDGHLIVAGSQSPAQRLLHALDGMSVRGRGLARRVRDVLMHAGDTVRARFADRRNIAVQAASIESEASPESGSGDESGLMALAILLHCHGIAVDPGQIRHRVGAARVALLKSCAVPGISRSKPGYRGRAGIGFRSLRSPGLLCCGTADF
jgi:subfamily B ATP-binding cassette protein HlyB/CyaB